MVARVHGVSRGRRFRRLTVLLVSVVIALGFAAAYAPRASAISHHWDCFHASGSQCWDPVGGAYSWLQVYAYMGVSVPEICAKARTLAGNTRTGSGCRYNWYDRNSCLAGYLPQSQAYVYWGGPGGARYFGGHAYTPADSTCPG